MVTLAPSIPADLVRARDGARDVPAEPPVLVCRAVGLDLDGRTILDGIDLELARGTFAALVGANGAGKTSLLRVLGTLVRPTRGGLALFGGDAGRGTAARRARIGFIGHQTMLYRDLTALENLTLFARLYGLARPAERALEVLGRVRALDIAGQPVGRLSRGTAQRVAIARSIIHDPLLLLADEPFTGLDACASGQLEELLLGLNASGTTIVMAHHDLPQALRLAGRALVLRSGRLILDARSADLCPSEIADAMKGG